MALDSSTVKAMSNRLMEAANTLTPVEPLKAAHPEMTIEDAYRVQLATVERMVAGGARIVGKKIGLTSKAMQDMFGVKEPDYGHLFDKMLVMEGEAIELSSMIQPRVEGEIAFILEKGLKGPGVTVADVLRASAGAMASIEVIDSRIKDWKIKIEDTVADNASSGALVLGGKMVPISGLDLRYLGMVVEKNGYIVATGAGAAVLGNPAQAVAWLANMLSGYGVELREGEIVLSGAITGAMKVEKGDYFKVTFGHLGGVSLKFT